MIEIGNRDYWLWVRINSLDDVNTSKTPIAFSIRKDFDRKSNEGFQELNRTIYEYHSSM
jgi:hypothetical protein